MERHIGHELRDISAAIVGRRTPPVLCHEHDRDTPEHRLENYNRPIRFHLVADDMRLDDDDGKGYTLFTNHRPLKSHHLSISLQ